MNFWNKGTKLGLEQINHFLESLDIIVDAFCFSLHRLNQSDNRFEDGDHGVNGVLAVDNYGLDQLEKVEWLEVALVGLDVCPLFTLFTLVLQWLCALAPDETTCLVAIVFEYFDPDEVLLEVDGVPIFNLLGLGLINLHLFLVSLDLRLV